MDTDDDPEKLADMQIEIKLDRDPETGLWKAGAFATWEHPGGEYCVHIGGSDNPIHATRADAALAMHEKVGEWIAENA
jgi:hypothetical protein